MSDPVLKAGLIEDIQVFTIRDGRHDCLKMLSVKRIIVIVPIRKTVKTGKILRPKQWLHTGKSCIYLPDFLIAEKEPDLVIQKNRLQVSSLQIREGDGKVRRQPGAQKAALFFIKSPSPFRKPGKQVQKTLLKTAFLNMIFQFFSVIQLSFLISD